MTTLEKGRGKYRNFNDVWTGKLCEDIFFKVAVIYNTFCNPPTGSFAWVGVQDKECIFLNNLRWSHQLLPLHDLLLLLEGGIVNFPAPKTHLIQDIQLTKDNPIFCTTKRPLLFIKMIEKVKWWPSGVKYLNYECRFLRQVSLQYHLVQVALQS